MSNTTQIHDRQIQAITEIEKIYVSLEDVYEHARKNVANEHTFYTPRSFKLCGHGDTRTAKLQVDPRTDGGYYPNSTHPIWISPSEFLTDDSPQPPTRQQTRSHVRNEGEVDRGSDKEVEMVETFHQEAIDVWKADSTLKDEITWTLRDVWWTDDGEQQTKTVEHAATVIYE